MNDCIRVKILGARGSAPVHGADYAQFGGATSCVLYQAGGESIILDAGTGLLRQGLPDAISNSFTMLLTHSHADHIIGFPMFQPLFDPSRRCRVYLKTRDGLGCRQQLEALMSPPLWPIDTGVLGAAMEYRDVPERFSVNAVEVETMEANHPGGSTVYKLAFGGKTAVYATDFEPVPQAEEAFCRFAKGCDLLLLDAQYTPEEYRHTKGFGHMHVAWAAELASRCQSKKTVFVHHDPKRTDRQLLAMEQMIQAKYPNASFARAGEELLL